MLLQKVDWPEEITWFLNDSLTGETVLSGLAPYDTTFVSQMGTIFFKVLIHMVMVGMMRYMTITDVSNGSEYLNFTIATGLMRIF